MALSLFFSSLIPIKCMLPKRKMKSYVKETYAYSVFIEYVKTLQGQTGISVLDQKIIFIIIFLSGVVFRGIRSQVRALVHELPNVLRVDNKRKPLCLHQEGTLFCLLCNFINLSKILVTVKAVAFVLWQPQFHYAWTLPLLERKRVLGFCAGFP